MVFQRLRVAEEVLGKARSRRWSGRHGLWSPWTERLRQMRWLRLLQLLARFLLKWIRTMLLQPDSIVPSYDICCFFFFFFFWIPCLSWGFWMNNIFVLYMFWGFWTIYIYDISTHFTFTFLLLLVACFRRILLSLCRLRNFFFFFGWGIILIYLKNFYWSILFIHLGT